MYLKQTEGAAADKDSIDLSIARMSLNPRE